MESKVNYALVGFCVILLSLALVATILWLSVGTEQKKYDTYQVYIQESVSGLNRKATVKYRGVNVGYVREIALVLERPNEVRLLLDIEQTVPLKQDTLVLLSTQGLTGLAYIELTGSSLNAAQPIHETGQLYPELQAKSSLLVRLDTAFSRFLENFNRIEPNKLLGKIENLYSALNVFLSKQNQSAVTNILQNFDKVSNTLASRTDTALNVFSEENQSAVTNILQNIDKVSNTLASRTDTIDSTLSNLLKTTQNTNKLITQLEKTLHIFAGVSQTLENTNNVIASFNTTSQKFNQTAEDVSIAVKKGSKDLDYFTRQSLPEITNMVHELQLLSTSLRHFIQKLERKPNLLLFGK